MQFFFVGHDLLSSLAYPLITYTIEHNYYSLRSMIHAHTSMVAGNIPIINIVMRWPINNILQLPAFKGSMCSNTKYDYKQKTIMGGLGCLIWI